MEFICSANGPIVETAAGKLRGYKLNGIYTFLGVRYATARRFHQPEPVQPWEGVVDATQYGDTAPYMGKKVNGFGDIRINHRYWPQDEACQYLNVWTDSLDRGAKKPVLVWIHGGGYDTGSSVELVCYDGTNAARYGDVVLVSLNHRLNIAGFLDLSAYGEEYANSGNAGISDIILALKWIGDNIAGFGGDPDNVTIFGQSGGGGKVLTLLQTPAADGLFHRVIAMSGVLTDLNHVPQDRARTIAAAVVEELGLTPETIHEIETVPFSELIRAYDAAVPKLMAQGIKGRRGAPNWAPVQNEFYPGDAREVGFTDHAKTVPLMLGSTLGEFPVREIPYDKMQRSAEERTEMLRRRYGQYTDRLLELFHEAYPGKEDIDLGYLDLEFRPNGLDYADLRAATCSAPTYNYLFSYDFPLNDGEPAWHCSDLPYVFHNAALVPVCNEAGVGISLENQFFGAWTGFARNGDPNNSFLPHWTPYTEDDRATMIIDRNCVCRTAFDRELIRYARDLPLPLRR